MLTLENTKYGSISPLLANCFLSEKQDLKTKYIGDWLDKTVKSLLIGVFLTQLI